jgi:hypothetical protein
LKSDESARHLALFMHKNFEKENPVSKHRQLSQEIKALPFDIIISLFRHLNSKDVFE